METVYEILNLFIQFFLKSLLPILFTRLVFPWITDKLNDVKFKKVYQFCKYAATAANQLGYTNEEKYNYVAQMLQNRFKWLDEANIQMVIEYTVAGIKKLSDDVK